jgi:hypothetical protein
LGIVQGLLQWQAFKEFFLTLIQAKLELMNGYFDTAIETLQSVVLAERAFSYKQADALVG